MMDDADRSIIDQQRWLDASIAAARRITPPKALSARACCECGEDIPEDRRQAIAGVQTCFDCSEMLESRRARGLR